MKVIHILLIGALALVGLQGMTSCKKKGPAEKLGEDIDRLIEDAQKAAEPKKGSAEKVGEKIDDALKR